MAGEFRAEFEKVAEAQEQARRARNDLDIRVNVALRDEKQYSHDRIYGTPLDQFEVSLAKDYQGRYVPLSKRCEWLDLLQANRIPGGKGLQCGECGRFSIVENKD